MTHLVRVTHPFHPLNGRQLVCVGERYNRYGTRLLLEGEGSEIYSVPRQWTDLVPPDPEIVLGNGRALVRVADLLGLADMVERLRSSTRPKPKQCKAKDVARVKTTTPRLRHG